MEITAYRGGKNRDYNIDKIRIVLAIFIVYIHAFNQTPANDNACIIWSNGYFDFIRIFISQGITRVGVPMFALFAGYFFGGNVFGLEFYKSKIKNRINSVLIPYVVWNIIAFIFLFLYAYLTHKTTSIADYAEHWGGLYGMFINWGHTPIDGPLWFMRDLLITIVVSPILYYLLTRLKVFFLILLYLVYLSGVLDSIMPITILTFFSIGYYYKIFGLQVQGNSKYRKVVLPLSIISLAVSCIYYNINDYYYYIAIKFFQISASYLILSLNTKKKIKKTFLGFVLTDLGPFSLFLYASHYIVTLPLVALVSERVCPKSDVCYTVCFLLKPIIVTYITYIIYRGLKYAMPKFLSFLIGGRV